MKKDFILRTWKSSDKESLVKNANNINVWNNVRDYFPTPYTNKDGMRFLKLMLRKGKPTTDFAIEINGEAVGGIGIIIQSDVEKISAEIGYWLGEDYWNKGIMTRAVKEMVDYVFSNLPIKKLYAPVFDFNTASHRVLEKVGFKREGILKKAAIKNGKIIDLHYYGLINEQ